VSARPTPSRPFIRQPTDRLACEHEENSDAHIKLAEPSARRTLGMLAPRRPTSSGKFGSTGCARPGTKRSGAARLSPHCRALSVGQGRIGDDRKVCQRHPVAVAAIKQHAGEEAGLASFSARVVLGGVAGKLGLDRIPERCSSSMLPMSPIQRSTSRSAFLPQLPSVRRQSALRKSGPLIGQHSLSHPVGAKAAAGALPDKDQQAARKLPLVRCPTRIQQALPRVTPAYAS
jgi:hypothetical protein